MTELILDCLHLSGCSMSEDFGAGSGGGGRQTWLSLMCLGMWWRGHTYVD